MSCITSSVPDARLRQLEKLAASIRYDLNLSREIMGISESAESAVVFKISCAYSPTLTKFVLVFPSQAWESFQIQTSTDGVTWTVADMLVQGAAAPALETVWYSEAYPTGPVGPVFFRVRRYPSCC